jgi:hypothetical protein
MNFFINKNATQPTLVLELIQDGRYDYKNFHELIQNSDIFFSMVNIETNIIKTCRQPAGCAIKENNCDSEEEYYITYEFTERDTSKPGVYKAKFEIEFADGGGTLIVPIREMLLIHVLDN